MDTPDITQDAGMTRRERREQRRMEQRRQQGNGESRRLLRRILIWGGSLAVLVGFGWLMVWLASDVNLPSEGGALAVPVSAADNVRGPASASVTLVEYSDFQCPACAAFHPIVKQLLDEPELAGKVRFVYRNFPLTNIHKNALLAARFAQAAAAQGKFWELHDALFENQQKWSGMSETGAKEAFLGYARDAGFDTEKLATDAESDAVRSRVQEDMDGGLLANVNSTPTFFVNGQRMPHPTSYEAFKQAILGHVTP